MVDISIVIAAYNEEKRLLPTLKNTVAYMRGRRENFEILIVNDGSVDQTEKIVKDFSKENKEVRIISHFPNQGRGASIREGIFASQGEIIIDTDADNSTNCEAIGRCIEAFRSDPELMVIFGSRRMKGSVVTKYQPPVRIILGKGFVFLSRCLFWMWNIHDFSLGFKAFRRVAAQDIFTYQYDNYYAAEAEIVFLSRNHGWKYLELPIIWTNDINSRIDPLKESIRSFTGIFKIIGNYFLGKYRQKRS